MSSFGFAGRIKEEHAFLALALLFGVLWVFLIPPFQSPDENEHFMRAWSLSEGKIFLEHAKDENGHFVTGAYLPVDAAELPDRLDYSLIMRRPFVKFNLGRFRDYVLSQNFKTGSNARIFQKVGDGDYAPVNFMPQVAGILAGRALSCSPLGCFYMARIFALFFYIIIVFAGLRIMPFGSNILMTVALLPMSLGIAASLNTDVVLNGVMFLFIAYVFSRAFKKPSELVNGKEVKIFLAFCVLIALLKPVYTPIVLLLLMLPKERFRDLKAMVMFIGGCFALTFLVMAAWNIANARLLAMADWHYSALDPQYQFHVALTHPSRMLGIMFNGYFHYPLASGGRGLFRQFIGILGWLDVVFPSYLYFISGLFLASQVLVSQDGPDMGLWPRAMLLTSFAIAAMGISFAMFVEATPVDSQTLLGVQGRYFTSIAPAALLAVSNTNRKYFNGPVSKAIKSPLAVGLCMAAILLAATYYIAGRYYYL